MVYYLSLTGNIREFVKKISPDIPSQSIDNSSLIMKEKSIFIFPTIGFGSSPKQALDFLLKNYQYISLLAGSGNKNWGASFCGGVDMMSERFGIPVFMKFELQGTNETVDLFKKKYIEYYGIRERYTGS